MSCIVYQTDKRTGIKYAYESVSYWDKEKKQPRSKRKFLGRVDPETNEIIKGRKKRTENVSDTVEENTYTREIEQLEIELEKQSDEIKALKEELLLCRAKLKRYEKAVAKSIDVLTGCIKEL